jgi:hypothetical protein
MDGSRVVGTITVHQVTGIAEDARAAMRVFTMASVRSAVRSPRTASSRGFTAPTSQNRAIFRLVNRHKSDITARERQLPLARRRFEPSA